MTKTAKSKLIQDMWKCKTTKNALLAASIRGEGSVTFRGVTYNIRSIFKNN